jgi:hypothetical protein
MVQPSERCKVCAIWILSTSKSHKVTNLGAWRSTIMHFFCRKSRTDNECCVCGSTAVMKLQESHRPKFPFQLASPSSSKEPGLPDNISDSLWHQVVQIHQLSNENRKKMVIVLRSICLCDIPCLGNWGVCHSSLCLLVSGSYSIKTFVTWYYLIKKIWFGSSRSSIKIKIIRNHLCTHFLRVLSCVTIWWAVH